MKHVARRATQRKIAIQAPTGRIDHSGGKPQNYASKEHSDNTTKRSVRKRKLTNKPTSISQPDSRPNGLPTPYSNYSSIPGTNPVKKLVLPHLQFGETVETRHFTISKPPNTYDHEEHNERREQPSLDWQRRWQIHKLHKYNRQTTTKKDYPQWYIDNPTDYKTPKRPLPESTSPETYIHDPDFNCDPFHNLQLYDRETLTFRQRECTPFEEYIKKTGMNISTEPRHRPKTVQPVPDYDQDVERVTEILVDDPTNRPKSILKNQESQITAPQSPPKDQPVNPIRAGILRSPTMDVAPDCQHENINCRITTEAVDLAQPTINMKTTPSKPTTRGIKRSLLLEPPHLNSQPEDEVEDTQPIMADETNMQPESRSGVANSTPQQDRPRSYLSEQTAEYPRQNHRVRGTPSLLSQNDRQSESEVENPRPIETATTNMQSGSPTGAGNDTPPQDEPQSYPTAQIAEYLTRTP